MEVKVAPEKLNAPAVSFSNTHQPAQNVLDPNRWNVSKLMSVAGITRIEPNGLLRKARAAISIPNAPLVAAAGADANLVKKNAVVLPEEEEASLYYRFDGL